MDAVVSPAQNRVLGVLRDTALAIRACLDELEDWGLADTRPGQYFSDLATDEVAVRMLTAHGLGVFSEETGAHHADRNLQVVLDPVDGSTNAARGIPWYATSMCVLDSEGPWVALVVNQATGERYEAMRGRGATRNGKPVHPSGCESLGDAIIAANALPPADPGARQMRVLGAAALDLCSVASGVLDAYIDFSTDALAPWDYLGGLLVCREAGAEVAEPEGRELVTIAEGVRRSLVAAATPTLLGEALAARRVRPTG